METFQIFEFSRKKVTQFSNKYLENKLQILSRLGWVLLWRSWILKPNLSCYMAHPTVFILEPTLLWDIVSWISTIVLQFCWIFQWLWRCQFRRNIKWLVKTLKLQIRQFYFKIWGIWVHFLKTKKCITGGLLSLEPRGGNIDRSRICCHNFPGWNNINSCWTALISLPLSLSSSL